MWRHGKREREERETNTFPCLHFLPTFFFSSRCLHCPLFSSNCAVRRHWVPRCCSLPREVPLASWVSLALRHCLRRSATRSSFISPLYSHYFLYFLFVVIVVFDVAKEHLRGRAVRTDRPSFFAFSLYGVSLCLSLLFLRANFTRPFPSPSLSLTLPPQMRTHFFRVDKWSLSGLLCSPLVTRSYKKKRCGGGTKSKTKRRVRERSTRGSMGEKRL